MKTRFAFILLFPLLAMGFGLIRPAGGNDKPLCCGQEAKADPPKNGLGRAVPLANYDYGNFKAVKGRDGKTRYFPRLAKHTDTSKRLKALPDSVDWSAKAANVVKRMYLNDQYGDCVLASRYHQLGFQTAADTGTGLEADDAEVYGAYQGACGKGDNGCDMSAVNQYQQKTGLKVKGVVHKSGGSVSVDHTNVDLVKTAILLFGGLNVGLNLPNDWYQSADGADWGPTNAQIVGGHEVQAFSYDSKGVWISTWAGKRRILWAAFTSSKWIDECYATLTADWYGADGIAPGGIDVATLKADLALIASGQIPPLPTPPGPTPVPPGPDPVPPTPAGNGYTGSVTYTYVNGMLTKITAGATPANVEDDLKSAGLNPAIILDVLKLLSDLKASPRNLQTILGDLLKIMADLTTAAELEKKNGRLVPEVEYQLAA